jgi:hypothetical protein
MPEIKNQFTGGKMNKDLDERLVPNGEYRDAMNIQVSTSEGSAVGTVQNILGNKRLNESRCNTSYLPTNAFTVGSVSDEKNDAFYWLVSGYASDSTTNFSNWGAVNTIADYIVRYGGAKFSQNLAPPVPGCDLVFVDKYAFSTPTTSTTNSNFLTGIPIDIVSELGAGWSVAGVMSDGATSPSSAILYSSITSVGFPVNYGFSQQASISSVYLSNVGSQGNANGGGFMIPMSPIFSGGWAVQANNVVYVSSQVNTTAMLGAEITILPNATPLLPPSTTITGITSTTLTVPNSFGGQIISVRKLYLSNNLLGGVIANQNSSAVSQLASGNAIYSYSSSGVDVNGIIGAITSTSVSDGTLVFNISDLDTSSLTIGDLVTLNGVQGCIGVIYPYYVPYFPSAGQELPPNNAINIFECGTTNIIYPLNAGTGPGQLDSGDVVFNNNISIELETPLDLSSGLFTSLFFKGPRTLNFEHNQLITGINIVDDMLFWTDNATEPKKINITRSIQGTSPSGHQHTKLVNTGQGYGGWYVPSAKTPIPAREEHITVIKKAPKNALTVKTETIPEFGTGTEAGNAGLTFAIDPNNAVLGNLSVNDSLSIHISPDSSTPTPVVGDVLLFNPQANTTLPPEEFEVKVQLNTLTNNGSTDIVIAGNVLVAAGTYQVWDAKIVSIAGYTSTTPQPWNWSIEYPEITTFKNKFPRFSYRWQYQDGEYSTFAPFTNVVFQPAEQFKYDIKEAYNIAMENVISKVRLKDYNKNLPEDVKSIDILYKESDSPSVYIVDTISEAHMNTSSSGFEVTPNQLKAVLPSNQLLRAWDNVPRKALAQEVSGSRVIYGNYLQNYSLEDNIVLSTKIVNRSVCDVNSDKKSLKSIRNYSLGVAYLDKYGRQSPVFTHKKGNIDIPIREAQKTSQLQAEVVTDKPEWATYCKFFVKDVSNEYYNLAMDRVYDARDGNIWLSFPSSDRNKVDEETFLILKKGVEGAQPVEESNRYKILAIENEAPTFIKTKQWVVAEAQEDPNVGAFTYFTNINGYPIESKKSIIINKTAWDGVNIPLSDIELMSVKFSREVGGQTQVTGLYDVVDFFEETTAPLEYRFTLAKAIKETWLNDPLNTSQPDPTIGMVVYKKNIEDSPEFDGRFFAKVAKDIVIDKYVVSQASISITNQPIITTQIPFYYLADQNNPSTPYDTTSSVVTASGLVGGASNTGDDWSALLDPEGTGTDSMWFIDAAHHAGYYDNDNTLQNHGMLGDDNFAKSGPAPNNPSELNDSGYNKGIYEENGQVYIDLSFGYVKAADGAGSTSAYGYAMHSDGTDTASVQNTLDSFVNKGVPNHPSYSNAYFQEMKDGFSHGDGFGGQIAQGSNSNDLIKHWKVGSILNANHNQSENREIVLKLQKNQQFQFAGDDTTYTITDSPEITFHLNYRDLRDYYSELGTFMTNMFPVYYPDYNGNDTSYTFGYNTGYLAAGAFQQLELVFDEMKKASMALNKRVTWKIPISANPTAPGSTFNPIDPTTGANATNIGTIQFVDIEWSSIDNQVVAEDPAIWETEPKKDVDLDIYYEVDGTFPLEVNNETNYTFAPEGSTISLVKNSNSIPSFLDVSQASIVAWEGNKVTLSSAFQLDSFFYYNPSNIIVTFHRPDGSCVSAEITGWDEHQLSTATGYPTWPSGVFTPISFFVEPDVSKLPVSLSWYNCYSFGNGVESQRVRDDFNQIKIDKGAKASSTLDESYKEEHRKYGLIYSGLYNSISGVNNLNQFIAAEKITKDINPTYGSIQKLHSRSTADGDLIALCEDRVLKILANKDAVFNADGNPQLIATENVLGQTIPYAGEFGISKNPESFASESYRAYFTDKVRGSVMRLSMDGLTPISDHGMKDYFRDNLKLSNKLIGSYDDKKDEYNITIKDIQKTVSFREDVRGWVSFKSFVAENAISCANEYYTFVKGKPWRHHVESVDRNTFHEHGFTNSSLTVLMNDMPGSIKSFKTVNYEGSQTRVSRSLDANGFIVEDGEYFNLFPEKGWFVESAFTDLEKGGVNNFIKKEGKWFGFINGDNVVSNFSGTTTSSFDTEDFSIQGIGMVSGGVAIIEVYGCMNPIAFNFNPNATIDNDSCILPIFGCIDPLAQNYNSGADTDDGSCLYPGCTDPFAFNYDITANIDDGSCIAVVYGCTDPTAFNYYAGANVNQVSGVDPSDPCEAYSYGCMNALASNYSLTYNTPCTDVGGGNGGTAPGDNNICCIIPIVTVYGCTDGTGGVNSPYNSSYGVNYWPCNSCGLQTQMPGQNYDPLANTDDGSCQYCSDASADNYDGATDPYTTDCIFCTSPTDMAVTVGATTTTQIGLNYSWHTLNTNGIGYYFGASYSVNLIVTETSSGNPVYNGNINVTEVGPNASFVQNNLSPGTEYTFAFTYTCNNTTSPTVVTINASTLDISGCTDNDGLNASGLYPNQTHGACNYDSTATFDNGTCEFTSCEGCTDPLADNYVATALFDDGSCTYSIIGCMDGTQLTTACGNVTYYKYSNYNINNTVASTCVPNVEGCTTVCSSNYNPNATIDDDCCLPGPCPGVSHTMNQDGSVVVSYNLLANGAPTCYSNTTSGFPNFSPDWGDIYLVVKDDQGAVISGANIGPMGSGTKNYTIVNTSGGVMGRQTTVSATGTGVASAAGSTYVTVDLTAASHDGNCAPVNLQVQYTMGCTDVLASNWGAFDITDNSQCIIVGCTDDTPGITTTYWASNYSVNNTLACTDASGGLTGIVGQDDNICCDYVGVPSVEFIPQNTSSGPNAGGRINQIYFHQNGGAYQTAKFLGPVYVNEHLHGLAQGASGANQAMHVLGDPTDTLYATILAGQVPLSTTGNLTVDSGNSTYIPNKQCLVINPSLGSTCANNGHGAGLDEDAILSLRYTVRFSAPLNNNISRSNLIEYDAVVGVSATDLTQNETFSVGCKYDPNNIYANWLPNVDLHAPSHCTIPLVVGCTDNGTQINGAGVVNDLHPTSTYPPPGASLNYNPLANVAADRDCCTHCEGVGNVTLLPGNPSSTIFVESAKITFTHRCEATKYEIEVADVDSGAWDSIAIVSQPTNPSFNQSTPQIIQLTGSALYSNSGLGLTQNIEYDFRVRTVCANGSDSTTSVPNTSWSYVSWSATN